MFFLIKIAKKGILLTCRVTWRAGPGGELTWRAGPASGCNVALRPRGRATAGLREAQVALTRGRRPRGGVHAGACEGRHMAGKDDSRRAHWYSGTLVREGGGNANYCMLALPLFIRVISHSFLRMGLCSHTVLPFAGDVDARRALDSVRTAEIAWTRVHAIIKSTRASKSSLSDSNQPAYLMTRGYAMTV